jgi:hypothetical protein
VSKRHAFGLALLAILVIAYVGLTTYAVVQVFRYDETVAQERRVNTARSCLATGRQNDAIVRYLRELGADPDEIQQARAFFPHSSQDDCEKRAADTVSTP